ncbi:biotin carboxylase N-terminal domain-containing protein [Mesorhizobium huakuii]|uniref:biotin carboxylase N-terminal domain-containing protein n=1 Tax=Mesorhizobium huakuii TaxID=28104 RepID=UPI0032AEBF51
MPELSFDTVLIANRGEIAIRIIKTLRELELRSAIVCHDLDAGTPAVSVVDVAVPIRVAHRSRPISIPRKSRCGPRGDRRGGSPRLWISVGVCGVCSQGVGGRHRVHWTYS